jgi:hypothetical protein
VSRRRYNVQYVVANSKILSSFSPNKGWRRILLLYSFRQAYSEIFLRQCQNLDRCQLQRPSGPIGKFWPGLGHYTFNIFTVPTVFTNDTT